MTLHDAPAPKSYHAPDQGIAWPPEANRAQFEMMAVPIYARIQIPLRKGSDFGIATIADWPLISAELRKLASEIDKLHAEIRTPELIRVRRLLNEVRHANKQIAVDSPRKLLHTKGRG